MLEIAETLDKKQATHIRDVSGNLVTPGLIDLHTHIYWGGTSIGVDPTDYAQRCGTTTMVDAGTAGAGNFAGFRAHIIEACEPRILAYLNISFAGIFAFSDTVMVGESEDLRLLHPRACLLSRAVAICSSWAAMRCASAGQDCAGRDSVTLPLSHASRNTSAALVS